MCVLWTPYIYFFLIKLQPHIHVHFVFYLYLQYIKKIFTFTVGQCAVAISHKICKVKNRFE